MIRERENKLQLIPKMENYIEYMLNVILKLPRTEKFNIGNEYKLSMYLMLENTLYIAKLNDKPKCLEIINRIDAMLNSQRIFLRIMNKNKWIDNKKFENAMKMIYEIGKIIGGLIKFYAKNNKEPI